MNLNLNELILTYEEMERIDRRPIGSYPGSMEEVAQAAAAKALWGLVDWLEAKYQAHPSWTSQRTTVELLYLNLEGDLEAAGIQRPGAKP